MSGANDERRPSVIVWDLKWDAVLWKFKSIDNNSNPIFDNPVGIKCRKRKQVSKPNSAESDSQETNVRYAVDREIPVQSVLWIGHRDSLPTELQGLEFLEVTGCNVTPDLNGSEMRITITTKSASSKPPSTGYV